MSKTLFERNFEEATFALLNINGKPVVASEMAKIFFNGNIKMPPFVREFKPNKNRPNAIVLLGQSCTGKTTFAKNFAKIHPEFEYLSMDDCSAREAAITKVVYSYTGSIFDNTLGFREFGETLTKRKNLIIDGGWLHINSRSALIKTLRRLGYVVTAFTFIHRDTKTHSERVLSRAIEYTAYTLLKRPFSTTMNWIEEYQKARNLTHEEAVAELLSSDEFENVYKELIESLHDEYNTSGIESQMMSGFIYLGFDSVVIV